MVRRVKYAIWVSFVYTFVPFVLLSFEGIDFFLFFQTSEKMLYNTTWRSFRENKWKIYAQYSEMKMIMYEIANLFVLGFLKFKLCALYARIYKARAGCKAWGIELEREVSIEFASIIDLKVD